MKKPNILWIMTDQQNADCLSMAGHPHVRTPNLDRLAERGTRFTQAYCQYPQCAPSRVSMMLGQYCKTHRMYGFVGNGMGPEPVQVMNHFRQHGYRTGAVGKFHTEVLGYHFRPDFCRPSVSIDWFQSNPEGEHYGSYLEKHGLTYPTHETHAGYGTPPPQSDPAVSDVPPEHNLEKWTADETIEFIRSGKDRDEPFFAFMSFERPHQPCTLSPEQQGRIDPDSIDLDDPETPEQLLRLPRIAMEGRFDTCSVTHAEPDEFRALLARYFTIIEMIDDQVGRVLEVLDELELTENTAIAFCSDHGDQAGRKRIFDKCLHASSSQIARIPFILCPPPCQAQTSPQTVDAPVESIDLYPTFCDWAGLPTPDHVEGRTLAPVCSGREAPDVHRASFCESFFRRSVVKDGWRFVYHYGGSVHELYHIAEDPLEYENLYQQPGQRERIDDLKHELIRFLSESFDEDDTRFVDHLFAGGSSTLFHIAHQRLHRSGCESGPFAVEGRALHIIEWKHWTLFYRVDTRRHALFTKADTQREHDLIDTPRGQWAYGELRDPLIDFLIRQRTPKTFWEPQPLGAEMPSPDQVEAYLSLPLMRD